METGRAWLVLSLGAEREYAGNVGYADELESVYRYDSFVPNHRQMSEGDLLLLCDRKSVLGAAKISWIHRYDEPKKLRRCSVCRIATIKERKEKRPRYRCRDGHEFDEPVETWEPCTHYAAHFEGAFHKASENIPVQDVRRADERERTARQIRARRGQAAFRQKLRERFNDTCLVTRCRLSDLLEAAHISPYRGEKDNHPSNGLLLRADIHTLFDLDLLGIHPETLQINLHPRLRGMGYENLAGAVLVCDLQLLSREALEFRWKRFQAGLPK